MTIQQPQGQGTPAGPASSEKRSGDRRVQQAFVVGWQMAQLFHYPVPMEPLGPPPLSGELPGLDRLSATRRYRLLARAIAAGYDRLGVPRDPVDPDPTIEATISALARPGHTTDEVREAVLVLHVQLMEALNVADFRLGKAYGLGRLLGEMSLPVTPAGGAAPDRPRQQAALAELFAPDRLQTLERWLSALKSDLPDHTAYAVSRSLEAWRGAHRDLANADLADAVLADGDRADGDLEAINAALRAQRHVWRMLLSGEKAAVDLLSAGDYVQAARAMLARSRQFAVALVRTFWWGILLVVVVVAATMLWVTFGGDLGGITKTITNVVALLAGLGVTLKGLSLAAARVAAKVEVPLWESELDEAVAVAATRLPRSVPPVRRTGDAVGGLAFSSTRQERGGRRRGDARQEGSPRGQERSSGR